MPEISRFFGIIIAMYYDDHEPPHFHVRYGEQKAIIAIDTLRILRGQVSPRAHSLVMEWKALVMLKDIVEVRPLEGYRLYLRFEDGVHGEVDLGKSIRFEGVFASLMDRAHFEQVRVNPDLGTVCWPSGADLDPDVLYAQITGKPLPNFENKTVG